MIHVRVWAVVCVCIEEDLYLCWSSGESSFWEVLDCKAPGAAPERKYLVWRNRLVKAL